MSDDQMGRREFLTRSAGLAGLAGLATVLPAETLISEAAKVQTSAALPSPRNIPIDTFVVLMMENRSFDHYLGWFPGADGRNKGLSYPDKHGKR
ncbi:MAG: phospholipase, partial [Actinobacteria bacterium]